MRKMEIIDFGIGDYRTIWDKQLYLQQRLIELKRNHDSGEDYIMLGEHLPVYTLGVHGKASNLLVSDTALKQMKCEIIRIERGGDITYHGPGQLIVYPIIDLEKYNLGVKKYVDLLEESVIILLQKFGIKGERVAGATGVWIDKGTSKERKICAIGVKISRFVTMHGLALNVNTDLSAFNAINPCGFIDKGVTSLEKEKGEKIDMEVVKSLYIDIFLQLLKSHTIIKEQK